MARPRGADDRDQAFLDGQIALNLDIQDRVEAVKELTDDPAVLMAVLEIKRISLTMQRRLVEYRPRLKELKKQRRLAEASGEPSRNRKGLQDPANLP